MVGEQVGGFAAQQRATPLASQRSGNVEFGGRSRAAATTLRFFPCRRCAGSLVRFAADRLKVAGARVEASRAARDAR